MKGLCKPIGIYIAIFLFMLLFRGTEAEAATTTDGKTYYDLRTEVDWTGYEIQRDIALSFDYAFILNNSGRWFVYWLSNDPVFVDINGVVGFQIRYYVMVDSENKKIYRVDDYRHYTTGWAILEKYLTGSGSEKYVGTNCSFSGTSFSDYPSQNFDFWEDTSISVDITLNGTDYTVSEDYPYYLALKNPQGNTRLFFSDIPFTASWVDLYTMQFEIASDANIVWYYWDSAEQNDFLASRTVSIGFDSFVFKSSGDYMSNYSIPDTDNPLYYFLPEKASFELPELTVKDLYAALPDELSKYYHIIIFRQDSENAYDNRILFYGWNDNNANLYIHSSNSQIAALNKKGVVSDYATAYYDEASSAWVISDDVVLGATTDGTYNVPFIYHSDLDLFVCDEWNVWNGTTAYLGDEERPLVSIIDPDDPEANEQETLLEKALNGLKKLFVSLFVPSDGFFTARVNEISSHFGFWTSVRDTSAVFIDFLNETDFTEPPKVEIDLSSINSKVSYGGKVYILDFSWYEPYKESVDVILSGILWLVFAWNTYKNLPNIINGVAGGAQASASLLDVGKEE